MADGHTRLFAGSTGFRAGIAGLLLLLADANAQTVAVFYPQVEEPYLSVFRGIAQGVATGTRGTVKEYPLGKDADPEQVRAWLRAERIDVAVSLGNRGYKLAKSLEGTVPTVVGGLPLTPNGLRGVSLIPAPQPLFQRLRELAPGVRSVSVVFGPDSAWLEADAKAAARTSGLELHVYHADSLREAARLYAELLPDLQGPTSALWLPTDSISADEQAVLLQALKAAWNQRFILFSSTPAHLKRGVLFSVIPDNAAMGERLAALAAAGNASGPKVIPAEQLGLAVNLRTAAHLGLNFTTAQERSFHMVFPPR